MAATVDEIINQDESGVDEALQPQPSTTEGPLSFEDYMGQANQVLQNLLHGGADQQEAAQKATQDFYHSFNQGEPGSIAERNNPNDFGSIARRDAFDLGSGSKLKEQILVARDVNAPSEVFSRIVGRNIPRVDLRFANFPDAPAAVRARSVASTGRYAMPPADSARRKITETQYPQLPKPTL